MRLRRSLPSIGEDTAAYSKRDAVWFFWQLILPVWIGAHIIDGPEMLELAWNQNRQAIHGDVWPPQCANITMNVIDLLFEHAWHPVLSDFVLNRFNSHVAVCDYWPTCLTMYQLYIDMGLSETSSGSASQQEVDEVNFKSRKLFGWINNPKSNPEKFLPIKEASSLACHTAPSPLRIWGCPSCDFLCKVPPRSVQNQLRSHWYPTATVLIKSTFSAKWQHLCNVWITAITPNFVLMVYLIVWCII